MYLLQNIMLDFLLCVESKKREKKILRGFIFRRASIVKGKTMLRGITVGGGGSLTRLMVNSPPCKLNENKAGYTATPVACGWAGALIKKGHLGIWAGAVSSKSLKTPKK